MWNDVIMTLLKRREEKKKKTKNQLFVHLDRFPHFVRHSMQFGCGHRPDDIQQHRIWGTLLNSIQFDVYIILYDESLWKQEPEFDWTKRTIGLVDSSFFWGYLITQVPGGFLASKYAANK